MKQWPVVSGRWPVGSRQKAEGRRTLLSTGHWPLATGHRPLLSAFCLLLSAFCLLAAERADTRPPMLRNVGFDQKLNEQVPLELVFRDENGRSAALREYFDGRPVILSLVYYDCPMLCSQVLNGLASSLDVLPFNAGKEFNVITVSFDPRETTALAAAKKKTYMRRYKRPGAAEGWHFLTGDPVSITRLAQAVGFRYAYDAEKNQYAHASGVMVLTPQGKLARYFYGIEYAPRDVRLALVEASANRIGSPVDQLLLYCYQYDPATGKYGAIVMRFVRLGGVVTVAGLLSLMWLLRRRDAGRAGVKMGGTV